MGLDPSMLPRVVRSGEVAGTVRDSHDLPFSKGTLVASGTGDNAAAVLKRADQALYRAKRDGRNRVVPDAA